MSHMKEALRKIGLITVSDITITTDQFKYFVPVDYASARTILAFCPGYQIGFKIVQNVCEDSRPGRSSSNYWGYRGYAGFLPTLRCMGIDRDLLVNQIIPENWHDGWRAISRNEYIWGTEYVGSIDMDILDALNKAMDGLMPYIATGKLPELSTRLVAPTYVFPDCPEYYTSQLDKSVLLQFVRQLDTK